MIVARALGLVLALWLAVGIVHATSGDARLDEYHVKAAFLFNFAKFVEWPQPVPRTRPFVVGVTGEDRIVAVVEDVVRGRTVHGRRMEVRTLRPAEDPRDCDIVFVTADEDRRSADLMRRAGGATVLTVGESEHFLRDGGIIRFVDDGNRVRFQINARAAQHAGLKISSQLLSLALP